jgi:ABC-type branched-subunit amino acid transport system substrate-binding protein
MMKRWTFVALVFFIMAAGLIVAGCSNSKEEASGPTPGGPVPGVTDTEILLGTHMPLTQSPAAAWGVVADGMKAYFDYINSQGGVYGRKIKLLVGDDHYSAPDAVEVVRKLVEQDHVFAIVGGLGDSCHLAVVDYLAEEGVPDLFIGGGMPEFTDPVVKTRFGMVTDYDTEGKINTDYIKEHFAGKTLGIIYEDNQGGRLGLQRTEEGLADSDIKIVSEQAYDFANFDLTAQVQRVKAANPDFVYVIGNPGSLASALKVAREVLVWDVPFVTSAVSAVEMTITLAGAANAEGLISFTTGRMISETDDPGVQRNIALMKQFAPNVEPSSLTEYGITTAELVVQALKNAGPNLTRESVLDGAEQIRGYCCIACIAPVNLSPTDHRPDEAEWPEQVVDGKWKRMSDTPVSYESTPSDVTACENGEPVNKGQ